MSSLLCESPSVDNVSDYMIGMSSVNQNLAVMLAQQEHAGLSDRGHYLPFPCPSRPGMTVIHDVLANRVPALSRGHTVTNRVI